MPNKRKISQKLRFEVFKRDAFKCQYCGKSAPLVVLHIDHVTPIAKGGTNDLMNLVTSCVECNLGKGPRKLDDMTSITRVQQQAELLNEKRQQMEMMFQWHQELKDLEQVQVDRISEYWISNIPGYTITQTGKAELGKLLKTFGLNSLLKAIDTAVSQYLEYDDQGKVSIESVATAFRKIGGILRVDQISEKKPHLKRLFYIRGILRNRVYVNKQYVMQLLENAVKAGIDEEEIEKLAKTCSSWSQFRETLEKASQTDPQSSSGEPEEVKRATQGELDLHTELIGNSVDLQMTLTEEYEINEDEADQITTGLGYLCGEVSRFLKEMDFDQTKQGFIESLLRFIEEKDWDLCKIPPPYRGGYQWSFQPLNKFLSENCEWNIPFFYYRNWFKTYVLSFPNLNMYDQFVESITHLSGVQGEGFQLIQQPKNFWCEPESIILVGVRSALMNQLNSCGLTPRDYEIDILLKFFGSDSLLQCVRDWISKWGEDGERIAYFDPEKEYTWEDFLLELNVNYDPLPEVICLTNDLEGYMEIYQNLEKAYFRGFYKNREGVIKWKECHSWDDYMNFLNEMG